MAYIILDPEVVSSPGGPPDELPVMLLHLVQEPEHGGTLRGVVLTLAEPVVDRMLDLVEALKLGVEVLLLGLSVPSPGILVRLLWLWVWIHWLRLVPTLVLARFSWTRPSSITRWMGAAGPEETVEPSARSDGSGKRWPNRDADESQASRSRPADGEAVAQGTTAPPGSRVVRNREGGTGTVLGRRRRATEAFIIGGSPDLTVKNQQSQGW